VSADVPFAAAGKLMHVYDAFQAEALALSKSIDIANELGVGRVVFETCCIKLKNDLSSNDYNPEGL
jgi:hypothetical protein